MGPADQADNSPDGPISHVQGDLHIADAFPSPASITASLETPTLAGALADTKNLWTPQSLLSDGANILPAEPSAATAAAPLKTPPSDPSYYTDMDTIVGGALAPVHTTAPQHQQSKPGPGFRLPSFEALGIAAPHPDRFGQHFSSNGAVEQPLALPSVNTSPLCGPFGMESFAHTKEVKSGSDLIGGPAVQNQVQHFISTLTPPAELGEMDWSSIAAVTNKPMESPATDPGNTMSLGSGGGGQAEGGASQQGMFPTPFLRDQPESWLAGALQTLLESLRTAPVPSNPMRVLSHALPSPSATGHAFSSILEHIHDSTPGSSTEWINVFHAIPGRFNLADLPTSPPSTPGPPIGGDDYFTQKVFDSAVPITDYQGDLSSLPRSPRPIVPPSSINVAVVERYIPPTSHNEFIHMFDTHGPSILVDRLVELSPNNGCLIFIYPTRTGAHTFMTDYLDPLWAPLLRSICVSHGLSSDMGKILGNMSAVDRLLEHKDLERSIARLCAILTTRSTGLHRLHGRQAEFTLEYSAKKEVQLSREVWARDWWTKQEKPRVREIVTRYANEAQKKSSNEHIERPATPAELIQQLLDGVVNKPYPEDEAPTRGIEVGVFVIRRSK
ncbi:hypothetical protein LTR78_006861 [Recurvomyces mirabilis]|uniref:Uncharacterized protein n=1 Tax=Recurvomyces mirabilis TaxID=574656 RepID=A0AAE0WKC4_9PEZI|nr:hypothetical protein LTR78_006861 [Recurvomyces mirabilis]KAK5153148.1 hypothetical protein LTS14_007793 [Recurvomyces mirabilis]